MNTNVNIGIHNKFEFEVLDTTTGKVRQRAVAYNIILNHMWSDLIGRYAFFSRIYFGSGTGTLDSSRTSLFSQLGYKTAVLDEQVVALPTSHCRKYITLGTTEYVGSTITEVGVGDTRLNTHALLQDSEGNPISITKTDTDIVTIYATIFSTITESDNLSLIGLPDANTLLLYLTKGGSTMSTTTRQIHVGTSDAASINTMRGLVGTEIGSTLGSTATTDLANKKCTITFTRLDVDSANGNIAEFVYDNTARLVLPNATVRPPVTYEDVPIGTGNGTTVEFDLPSQNIDQSSIVIKNNSTIVSNYTKEILRDLNFIIQFYSSVTAAQPEIVKLDVSGNYWYGLGDGYASSSTSTGYGKYISAGKYLNGQLYRTLAVNNTNLDFGGSSYSSNRKSFGISPTETILAVPLTVAPYVAFYDTTGGGLTPVTITLDTALPSAPNDIAFSPDGQHIVFLCNNSVLLRYKKTGSNLALLPGISGEPVLNVTGSYASSTRVMYKDTLLVVTVTAASPYIITFKRSGDTYTLGTVTGSNLVGLKSTYPVVNNDGTKILTITSDGTNIAVFTVDASGNITREENIAGSFGTIYALALLDSDNLLIISSTSPYAVICKINATYTSITQFSSGSISNPPVSYVPCFIKLNDNQFFYSYYVSAYPYDYHVPVSIDTKARKTKIIFDTPPTSGDAITATYDVNGIHKTSQYVIDASVSFQFGEGV